MAGVAALTVCQAAFMVGWGLLITGPGRGVWPLTVEDKVNEGLEQARTASLTRVSLFVSEAGNTLTVVAVTVLVCAGLLWVPRVRMWRQAAFLAVAVSLQSLVFLVVTEAVDRHRPEVDRLDASPPTSSYTSGHTGAATALYGGLAVLALSRLRGPWRRIVGVVLLVVPVLVAAARLYRGMHHPTDVVGGLANGSLSLLIVGRVLLTGAAPAAPDGRVAVSFPAGAGRGAGVSRPGGAVVVLNPTVTGEADREVLRQVLERHGHRAPVFVETTAEDPGGGQAAAAVQGGAGLVVVCGGDGTVRAAADALAGSGVPLAVVPCGTGNLLARNLGLPLVPAEALEAALRGTAHRLDLGRVEGDGLPVTHFAAMSGAGLDAAVMENTGERTKSVLGWPAYVLAGISALRTPRMELTLRLDGAPAVRRRARMVLMGNVGTVQGGVTLLPAARPDDGLLDLLVLDPRGVGGWIRALAVLVRGRAKRPRPHTVAHTTAAHTEVRTAPGTTAAHTAAAHTTAHTEVAHTAAAHTEAHAAAGTTAAAGTAGRAVVVHDGEGGGAGVEFFTFRRAELVFGSAESRELDGDPVAPGRRLTAEVRPGVLTVLLPAAGR